MQDFGRVKSGDKISCNVNISAADKETIFRYWENREPVTIEDEAGNLHENCRVVVKEYSYIPYFPKYYSLSIEIWRL